MTFSGEPTVLLSHLHRTDGSATFSQNGYTIIASVNGPIEVTRRDELPEEAALDVIVRPAAGVGGTRERCIEDIIRSTLRQIILIHNFPRTLIQVTLQVTNTPENDTINFKLNQASLSLPILPALLQASVLALLSSSIPLTMTLNTVLLAILSEGTSKEIVPNPSTAELRVATSTHVLGFTSQRRLLLNESEGSFSMKDWTSIYDAAETLCCGSQDDDNAMLDEGEDADGGMAQFVRSTLQEKVDSDLGWKP